MTVKQIITDWLKAHGCDGLINVRRGCSCAINNGMFDGCASYNIINCQGRVKDAAGNYEPLSYKANVGINKSSILAELDKDALCLYGDVILGKCEYLLRHQKKLESGKFGDKKVGD